MRIWKRKMRLAADVVLARLGFGDSRYTTTLSWRKRGNSSWLAQALPDNSFRPPLPPRFLEIESRASLTQSLGSKGLWEGYGQPGSLRDSEAVRSGMTLASIYSWLVSQRQPETVVEFGTAFGVSGMYWLAGLEAARHGQLLTFEPNAEWCAIARTNLESIGRRFTSINGTFEEHVDHHLKGQIDIALIDAIHTSAFVMPQFELVCARMKRRGLVLFDDIDFSQDMADCWSEIAMRPDVAASVDVNGHLGIIELV